jgi:hypothetical protein
MTRRSAKFNSDFDTLCISGRDWTAERRYDANIEVETFAFGGITAIAIASIDFIGAWPIYSAALLPEHDLSAKLLATLLSFIYVEGIPDFRSGKVPLVLPCLVNSGGGAGGGPGGGGPGGLLGLEGEISLV